MAVTKIPIDEKFINTVERIDAGELTQKEAAEMLGISPPGLHKKISKYKRQQPPASLLELSERKQVFCQAKAALMTNKDAARLAFPDAKETSLPVIASQIMAEPNAQVAIHDLMARNGIDRNFRVSRLKDVICSPDLNIAVKGLDQSWKLTGEYAAEKLDIAVTDIEIRNLISSLVPDKIECIEVKSA